MAREASGRIERRDDGGWSLRGAARDELERLHWQPRASVRGSLCDGRPASTGRPSLWQLVLFAYIRVTVIFAVPARLRIKRWPRR
ncbi:MAG TPA: hypothetical protein VN635_14925 [Conexibacter sp.]|nr:hypothetical protein [Conexibacter sp.]